MHTEYLPKSERKSYGRLFKPTKGHARRYIFEVRAKGNMRFDIQRQ